MGTDSIGERRRGGAAVSGRPPAATLPGGWVWRAANGCAGVDAERGADGVDAKAAWIGGRIALCIVLDILSSALSRSSACCLASRLLRSCCSSVSCSATQCRRSLTFDCAACSWPCSRAARSCCSRSSAMAAGRPDATQRAQRKHKRRLAGWGVQPAVTSSVSFSRLKCKQLYEGSRLLALLLLLPCRRGGGS